MNRLILLIGILFLWVSCATPGSPLGGAQDATPPKVEDFTPAQLTTNFKSKSISIRFDEWVTVVNIKQNLIISPPLKEDPIITARKNYLNIHFKSELDSNTTYSIFFGQSVKDNNEGNVIDNLQYVFSTGDYLDSLKISGKVTTTDQSSIPENTFVQLYKNTEDSIITTEKPLYIYKLEKDGSFNMQYLPTDTFRLFVLNDLNNNYKYDLPTEWIGKYDSLIALDSNVSNLEISIYLPEDSKIKIKDYNNKLKDGILTVEFNKELNPRKDSVFIKNFQSDELIPFSQKTSNRIYNFFIINDTLSNTYILYNHAELIDSITVKPASGSHEKSLFLPTAQMNLKNSILKANKNGLFTFNTNFPIKYIHPDKIYLISKNDTVKMNQKNIQQSNWKFSTYINLSENEETKILFLDSAIQFYGNKFSDSISYNIASTKKEELANLILDIKFPSKDISYVLRVFTKDNYLWDELILENTDSLQYQIKEQFPNDYFIEVIEDLNKSGTWNGASFWDSRKPERVFKSQVYSSRANWDDKHKIQVDFTKSSKLTDLINPLEEIKSTAKSSSNKIQDMNANPPSPNSIQSPNSIGLPDLRKGR
ncbi:MAG: Ig-like domain-containing protein [Chitinophagales bacterium]|nr:Ig-like domain-containing protein [Chitinophagales bacterium]